MESNIFAEISLVIAIGTFIGLVMRLLKQPLIISYILTGIVVGPAVLNIIHSEELFEVFASLGITLLLFIIGLGLNPKVVKEVGRVAFLVGTIQVGVTTVFGYFAALALGYTSQQSGLIGLALAFSSTIIILKLISDKKEQTRLYAKLAIGLLIVQDIIAAIALLFLTTSAEGAISGGEILFLVLKGSMLIGLVWLMGGYVLPKMGGLIADNQEFLFLFALAWGLGIASLFELAGFSLEVGALIAGVGLSTQKYTSEVSARLRPLRDFFVVVFFITLGSELIIDNIAEVLWPAIILSLLVIILNPVVIYLTLGLIGYTRRTSFKTAIAMAQISEFSLVFVILATRQGRLTPEILSMMTLVAMITIAVSTYLIMYSDQIYAYLEDHFKLFEHRKVHYDQDQAGSYPIILFGFKKGGPEFVKVFRQMNKKFVVVDYDPEVIDTLQHRRLHYLYGDATDIELLDEINLEKARLVVSTITEHAINKYIVTHVRAINEGCVVICHSDTMEEARDLYEHGASYVMMSHSIGSEKIGSFLKKNGFKKSEFKKFRDKHLLQLETEAELQARHEPSIIAQ